MIIHKSPTDRLWIRFEMAEAERVEKQDCCEPLQGKARVEAVFIQPLLADGLRKSARVKSVAHEAFLKRMRERLAYLDSDQLARLRDQVLQAAGGHLRNIWPDFATVWNYAVQIAIPPDRENPIMRSWMLSIEGPRLRDAGLLVEVYSQLRRNPRPPLAYDMVKIRERHDENKRRCKLIDERLRDGVASAEERAWRQSYQRTLDHCLALVAQGEAARAGKVGA